MSKFDNQANAINKRLINIAKTYGINHPAYETYANHIKMEHLPTRRNADGVLQISRTANPTEYQAERVEQLYKSGKTTRKIRKAFRKKHKDVKAKDVDKEIRKAVDRQQKINETLERIYKYIDEGTAPTDLVDKYNHFKEHETSNEEIDAMIEDTDYFTSVQGKISELTNRINTLDAAGMVDEDILQDIWELNSGRLSVEEVKEAIEHVEEWLDWKEGEDDDED